MSNHDIVNGLHLSDLSITGFRGIDRLSIPKLGRVTLLAGRNGVGKTTVLEAVRIYAERGKSRTLTSLLQQRDELAYALDEGQDSTTYPDYSALFHGRDVERGQAISIGPIGGENDLRIEGASPSEVKRNQPALFADADILVLKIVFAGQERFLPWAISMSDFGFHQARPPYSARMLRSRSEEDWPRPIGCESLGPGLLENRHLATLWNAVALTEDEDRATEALRLVRGNAIDRVAVVGDDNPRTRRGQRVIVKLSDHPRPVPLRSLGDGATRLFGVALALANSRDGFLLIDGAENGIHHSVQEDYWNMVLLTAHRNNVQVVATTHSWDCVKGFANASDKQADIEGVLLRLEQTPEGVRAVGYAESDLLAATDQSIEVR